MRAAYLDVLGVETRRGDGEPQKIESGVAIFDQGTHRAADGVALGRKAHLDRFAFEPVRKRF